MQVTFYPHILKDVQTVNKCCSDHITLQLIILASVWLIFIIVHKRSSHFLFTHFEEPINTIHLSTNHFYLFIIQTYL